MATTRTIAPLIAFDEKGITYLAATNAGWLLYLADEGIWYVHYFSCTVKRLFGLDQDILDDFTLILDTTTLVYPFLQPSTFEF